MTKPSPGGELRRLGIRPSRGMGQNFLKDVNIADWIVEHASIEPGEKALEIGPGLGILTERLAKKTDNLQVIELDLRLAENLEKKGFNVIRGDALEMDWPEFDKMVSNLPYQISSPVVLKLLEHDFKLAVLMFQKEFAEHLVAKPGQKAYSRLSVMAGYRSESGVVKEVPKGCFEPAPKVDSVVVDLKPKRPDFDMINEQTFKETVRILFSHKNRKVRNGIQSEHSSLGLDKSAAREIADSLPYNGERPTNLSPEQLAEIADALYENGISLGN